MCIRSHHKLGKCKLHLTNEVAGCLTWFELCIPLWLGCQDCCCCLPPANSCSVQEGSISFTATHVRGFLLAATMTACALLLWLPTRVCTFPSTLRFELILKQTVDTHSATSEDSFLSSLLEMVGASCHALSKPLVSECRFPGRARALADSIQAWLDMQGENAQAFRNKLDATFIQRTKHVPKPASVMSNDSRRESSESLIALSDSGSPAKPLVRTSSSKRAVLVAR